MTVKVTPLDVPPPGAGLKTVTVAVPAEAMSLAGIVAVRLVLLPNVVVRFAPCHRTTEPETKPEPVTVSVKAPPPATAEFGLMLEMTGAGLLMLKVTAFDVPPPPPGLKTVTEAVPATAMSLARIVAVLWVPPEPDVARFEPFQRTTVPPAKFEPLTVSVKLEPPASAEFGEILLMDGVCALTAAAEQARIMNVPSATNPTRRAYCELVRFTAGLLLAPPPDRRPREESADFA